MIYFLFSFNLTSKMSFCVQDKIEFLTLRSVSSGPIRLNLARTKKKKLTNDHHECTKESTQS